MEELFLSFRSIHDQNSQFGRMVSNRLSPIVSPPFKKCVQQFQTLDEGPSKLNEITDCTLAELFHPMLLLRPPETKPRGVLTVSIENTGYLSVERCIIKMGYHIVWDRQIAMLFWCDTNVSVDFCLQLKPWQFVNHFPGTFAISRKIELARNMERLQKTFPDLYNFHPRSLLLPTQASDLKLLLSGSARPRTFIIKPDLGSQGRGIFLVQDSDSVSNCRDPAVAQEYISPYLIDDLKFDLRIYVLLASVDPLRIYIFKEGMARFCTETYRCPTADNLKEIFRHLTNYSVNKHNTRFKQNEQNAGTDDQSHKRSMSCVFSEIAALGGDVDALRSEIDRIVVLTILSVQPWLQHNYRASFKSECHRSRCFEILGFDVLIDKDLKPWVLEVNHSPSLSCDSGFDMELKDKVIMDSLKIADIPPDYMEQIQQDEREKTRERISGAQVRTSHPKRVYTFEREQRIARGTDWRMIFPNGDMYQEVIENNGFTGMDDTLASSKRKVAIKDQISKLAERYAPPQKKPGKVFVPKLEIQMSAKAKDAMRPTKSVLLLKEARLAKISEEANKETRFMFSQEYEEYVKEEKNAVRSYIRRRRTTERAVANEL
jgi:tubulin polyglutamylase TTLL6/13